MKICSISDPHGYHDRIEFDQTADVLVCAGDMGGRTTEFEARSFMDWFFNQKKFTYKIFIAGNHDTIFERWRPKTPPNVVYLENEVVVIENVMFYGSPVSPTFFNWHFMMERGKELQEHWDKIPLTADVVITHGPPKIGSAGLCENGFDAGDLDLATKLLAVKPKLAISGHIHEGYGVYDTPWGGKVVNASFLDENYRPVNKPIYSII